MQPSEYAAKQSKREIAAIVIGGSAGSVEALKVILPRVRETIELPVVCVLHVKAEGKSQLARAMSYFSTLPAKEAESTELLKPGTLYFAPPDYHLSLERNGCFSLSTEPPVHYSRPSIDVLFESAAEVYKSKLVGILLSGANADGARGLKVIKELGGLTIVQNPQCAPYPTMPESAIRLYQPDFVLSLDQTAEFISRIDRAALLL